MTKLRTRDTLKPSVVALLGQIVDYAGLFPPARLDMAPTVENYAGFVRGGDAWMLGRLIIPAARLGEFESASRVHLPHGDAEPWHLSALVAPAGDATMAHELERVAQFNERHADGAAGRARIETVELRAAETSEIERALDAMPDDLFPFFELPIERDCRGLLAALVGSDAGAKVRTGGVSADLYPQPEHLARFIAACAAARVPFKATAGLHHPLRHRCQALECKEFGFLNVFVAAVLAWHGNLSGARLTEVLSDEHATSFGFEEEEIVWQDQRLTLESVADTRERFAISFGSCSFDEPCQDLRAMGLL